MKNKKIIFGALVGALCLTGCFDKYNDELSADEAKAICQAIIDNSKRPEFNLPSQYGINAHIIYEQGDEKSDVKGKLLINEEKTFIYLSADVKEGTDTEYKHSEYFLYDDAENNKYIEGIVDGEDKKYAKHDKSTNTAEEMFDRARDKVSGTGKSWVVQSDVLQLFVDNLLIDYFVKGLHVAENIPEVPYECSMKSDGELNFKVIYKFNLGETDTDIDAEWKNGYLLKGNIHVQNETGYSDGFVNQIDNSPFLPDLTGFYEYTI